MKRFLVILLIISFKLQAQDAQFTQFNRIPMLMNPAMTGTSGAEFQFASHNRRQWNGLGQAYTTLTASFEYNDTRGFNVGGMIVQDNIAGQAWGVSNQVLPFGDGISNTSIIGLYSYGFQLGRRSDWRCQLGFSGLYSFYGLQQDVIWSKDVESGKVTQLQASRGVFDVSGGFLVSNQKFWFGAAGHHLNQRSGFENQDGLLRIPLRISAHVGALIPLMYRRDDIGLLTNLHYKMQGQTHQTEMSASLLLPTCMFGMAYRGLGFPQVAQTFNHDAFAFMAGVHMKKDRYRQNNFSLVYSYDMTISALNSFAGGSHELSLIYNWTKTQNRDVICPHF